MVNYWLRTNKKENWEIPELWKKTQKVGQYEKGDGIILYVIDTKGGKYLVAVWSADQEPSKFKLNAFK